MLVSVDTRGGNGCHPLREFGAKGNGGAVEKGGFCTYSGFVFVFVFFAEMVD